MKIAFFVSNFPIRSETFVMTQIAGLLDRGHDVDIWANEINDPADLHADFERYRLLERVRCRRRICGGTPVRRVLARVRLLARHIWRDPALVVRALNVFRFGKKALSLDLLDMALCFPDRSVYDVVHCHFGPNGNDAALLTELGVLRGKLVTTFHSYDILQGIETNGACYRRLIQRADAVHSISEYNRKWLEYFGFPADRIYYQPMGIDLSQFSMRSRYGDRSRALRILTVARLAPAKGLAYGLDALAAARRELPELRFRYRIIGSGPLEGTLQNQAVRLGLRDIVEFAGFQDQAVVRAALRDADLFFLPSLAEGLPIAIMEAMASGLPVIATDVGGNAELVRTRETGRLVPPGDAQALKTALLELLEIPNQWRHYGERARELVKQRHDASILSDRLVRHYRSLIDADAPDAGQRSAATVASDRRASAAAEGGARQM